ncbi:MAG TPA: hypothetical protein VE954_06665 [Oligoflexus sp.]|uniref:phage head-tail joining protein n=1 Tax=Oligoflexus sp. TaxID=1971216 RepID=UPI002D6F57D3|nr:hypothetical protein [Oligoflexus sp.]HYX32779.1 hypothetical protein [Oligoflexus sp.]
MSWSEKDLERLEKAYKNGLTQIEFDGQLKQFRSLADLKELIDEARQELSGEEKLWSNRIVRPVFRR